jgi:HAMP domain-containing protein
LDSPIFAFAYDLMKDKGMPLFFLGILFFSLLGMAILRKLFEQIIEISAAIADKAALHPSGGRSGLNTDEINSLMTSFNTMENQFDQTYRALEKKSAEIVILKELSDICYVTFDAEEILNITLERALILTNSDIGSVMILDKTEPKTFIVKVNIGLGEHIQLGQRIDFETSVAKYAVINKSPIVVKDVETDNRFKRTNRSHYGTKSFICMPIKTSSAIVGVLSISRKDDQRVYTHEDARVLTPLLSNAAFTYENRRLIDEKSRARDILNPWEPYSLSLIPLRNKTRWGMRCSMKSTISSPLTWQSCCL